MSPTPPEDFNHQLSMSSHPENVSDDSTEAASVNTAALAATIGTNSAGHDSPTGVTAGDRATRVSFNDESGIPAQTDSPSGSDPTSSPSSSGPAVSSRSGFLSRFNLSLPLRTRNRNVADFHVRCDQPYKKYCAGEKVRGAVVLTIGKPVRITHLVVSLQGYVRVHKAGSSGLKVQSQMVMPQGDSAGRPQYHGHGLATLFSDEQVLSGEGKIDAGRYEFRFDLLFPRQSLPSSIDFERGTISYVITATLTRPTSISPVSSCDRKIMLVETIDVGLLPPPKPRSIFLEPISKRTKRKRSMVLDKTVASTHENNEAVSEASSVVPSVTTDESERTRSMDQQQSTATSDMRSEMSEESGRSVNTAISRAEMAQLSQVGTTFSSPSKQQVVDDKTIIATLELVKGGCLPGDMVAVRVAVQHIKRMKSMTGVIVTLYRQGKIDSSPSPSKFLESRSKYHGNEVFPKSKTRLGGLSLSSTSSTSIFRKDLDQNMVPLFIDPSTMQASVTVAVKLPDDAFPTIRGVPGDMISFKYKVEVIVDLGGKLSHQFQSGKPSRTTTFGGSTSDPNNAYGPKRSTQIADTSQLRREKGVISMSFETVVGTIDSSLVRKRRGPTPMFQTTGKDEVVRPELGYLDEDYVDPSSLPEHSRSPSNGPLALSDSRAHRYHASGGQPGHQPYHLSGGPQPGHYSRPPPTNGYALETVPSYEASPASSAGPSVTQVYSYPSDISQRDFVLSNGNNQIATPAYIPPPQVLDQQNMTEKERIRQAETRLLPSEPPQACSSSSADNSHNYDAQDIPRVPYLGPDVPNDEDEAGPSAPPLDELSRGSHTPRPADDKQELERRRLQEEASAPPVFPDDSQASGDGPSAPSVPDLSFSDEPSAPSLEEEDQYPAYASEAGPSGTNGTDYSEQLPAYVR